MITFIIGPSKSGKTEFLLKEIDKATIAGKTISYVYPDAAKIYLSKVIKGLPSSCRKDLYCEGLSQYLKSVDAVFVDEAYLMPNLKSFLLKLSVQGTMVYVASLESDRDLNILPEISNALPLADSIIRTSTVCSRCHSYAGTHINYPKPEDLENTRARDKFSALCTKCVIEVKEVQSGALAMKEKKMASLSKKLSALKDKKK